MQPDPFLTLSEPFRATKDIISLLAKKHTINAKTGYGSILLIPGYCGDDTYNIPMRKFLSDLGYTVSGWEQNRNRGHKSVNMEKLQDLTLELSLYAQEPITIIGHSLGGVYARYLAHIMPNQVSKVITLGSPLMVDFNDEPDELPSPIKEYYLLRNPMDETAEEMLRIAQIPPLCDTVAIYTKEDGIVRWDLTLQPEGEHNVRNIEVEGSHSALTLSATVWAIVAEELAQRREPAE